MKDLRAIVFLKDVLVLALGAIGGPQAHIVMFIDILVKKRKYLNEKDLLELNALCQILPGPTSTQTITAIGYKKGGVKLAYMTLFIWALPAVSVMIAMAFVMSYLGQNPEMNGATRFIKPMAIGFVAYGAYNIIKKVVKTQVEWILMIMASISAYFFQQPWAFPLILIVAGVITSVNYKDHKKEKKERFTIKWGNFVLFLSFFIVLALLGNLFNSSIFKLFENFYRNGSLVFGGGQVLVPILYNEFVTFKQYLTSEEFLAGYSFVQAIPGPVFSFTGYIGALSMMDKGVFWAILGGMVAAVGIFLPGTFLIFFVIRFWEQLKKYRPVKASLQGITSASAGMVLAAVAILGKSVNMSVINISIIVVIFLLLQWKKIPNILIITTGILLGILI